MYQNRMIFGFILFYMYEYSVCVDVWFMYILGPWGNQKRALELELQMISSHVSTENQTLVLC